MAVQVPHPDIHSMGWEHVHHACPDPGPGLDPVRVRVPGLACARRLVWWGKEERHVHAHAPSHGRGRRETRTDAGLGGHSRYGMKTRSDEGTDDEHRGVYAWVEDPAHQGVRVHEAHAPAPAHDARAGQSTADNPLQGGRGRVRRAPGGDCVSCSDPAARSNEKDTAGYLAVGVRRRVGGRFCRSHEATGRGWRCDSPVADDGVWGRGAGDVQCPSGCAAAGDEAEEGETLGDGGDGREREDEHEDIGEAG